MLSAPNTPWPPPLGVTFVSPGEPQPGPIRIVGAGCSFVAVASGNQCRRMWAPSNDTIVLSLADPATGVTVGADAAGREQVTAVAPRAVVVVLARSFGALDEPDPVELE